MSGCPRCIFWRTAFWLALAAAVVVSVAAYNLRDTDARTYLAVQERDLSMFTDVRCTQVGCGLAMYRTARPDAPRTFAEYRARVPAAW